MTTSTIDTGALATRSTDNLVEMLLQQQSHVRPFVRWHLRCKFQVMEDLFRRYLRPGAKLADIACGTGDALVLAAACVPGCEGWGLDMDDASLDIARRRLPTARLYYGDMRDPKELPSEYFDAVHEFGATFLASCEWHVLARAYLSLLKQGGVLLWELPQRWSLAHLSYLVSLAPQMPNESKLKRILRSLRPSKYRFESDESVMKALEMAGCDYEILERVSIGYFFFPKMLQWMLDWTSRYFGDQVFEALDKAAQAVWPKKIGYYLVIRKGKAGAARGAR